ncbi:polyphosphate glucokinase [Cyclonatronum proteinivorum]|uniref:Polyphosphate glucokinase n=1 Tax=Cyclonatronum proteinivorum TaxID=1457365 RepID=A0A345UHG5_9BACT|nr:ROK family protein [Cyclonatronum proteinivorum]AXI99916.1 polyphosphate glucokinase [Cyclonatronum proteinivorum]
MQILGIDIGSSAIKGCVADCKTGVLTGGHFRIPTPADTSPHKLLAKVYKLVSHFKWQGPVGFCLPEPVRNGVVVRSLHFSPQWADVNAAALFEEMTDCPVAVINDADAAGLAEVQFGCARNVPGIVILLTVGTGIGSAVFVNGQLLPNTELGFIPMEEGLTAAELASVKTKHDEGLKRKKWAKRLEDVLQKYEEIFHPDLFVISGSLSHKAGKTFQYIDIRTPLKPAHFLNNAGILGAALHAGNSIPLPETHS